MQALSYVIPSQPTTESMTGAQTSGRNSHAPGPSHVIALQSSLTAQSLLLPQLHGSSADTRAPDIAAVHELS